MFDSAPLPAPSPATAQSSSAPRGAVGSTVNCCPEAAVFSELQNARNRYYGYDGLSNIHAPPAFPAYWTALPGDVPGDKTTRDGSAWVSVPVGGQTEVDISFLGSVACIGNCTYEVDPGGVAQLADPAPTAAKQSITIIGLSAGEASLKVKCEGRFLGYIRIWCQVMLTIEVGVGTIRCTSEGLSLLDGQPLRIPQQGYVQPAAAHVESLLNLVMRQALVTCRVTDIGEADFMSLPAPEKSEAQGYVFDNRIAFFNQIGMPSFTRNALENKDEWDRVKVAVADLARRMVGGGKRFNIWYMVSDRPLTDRGSTGEVVSIPGGDLFLFSDEADDEDVIAHELGHLLGLYHPEDASIGSQIPQHLRATETPFFNLYNEDPLNVMSYSLTQLTLLYSQWVTIRNTLVPPDSSQGTS